MSTKPAIDGLPVAGLTRMTSIDYPGELACVVFLQGCPWRCGYCQNSELQARNVPGQLQWDDILAWLQSRQGLLDAVVFSGGEPTLHRGLATALQQVRALGYKTGLHSAGIYPERLQSVLPLLDWVGLDIKAPYAGYDRISGVPHSAKRAWLSARYLVESGTKYEIRTTVHPDQLDENQLRALAAELKALDVDDFVIQHCVLKGCADENLRRNQQPRAGEGFLQRLGKQFAHFEIRDAA